MENSGDDYFIRRLMLKQQHADGSGVHEGGNFRLYSGFQKP